MKKEMMMKWLENNIRRYNIPDTHHSLSDLAECFQMSTGIECTDKEFKAALKEFGVCSVDIVDGAITYEAFFIDPKSPAFEVLEHEY